MSLNTFNFIGITSCIFLFSIFTCNRITEEAVFIALLIYAFFFAAEKPKEKEDIRVYVDNSYTLRQKKPRIRNLRIDTSGFTDDESVF